MWYKDVRKDFGLAIKKWRGNSGISQEELAWRAGLHRSYVADIERGARNASLQSIEKLAKALKVSLSALFEPLDKAQGTGLVTDGPDVGGNPVDILLVEDELKDIELTLRAFKEVRLTNHVHVVHDGAEALDFVFGKGDYARRKSARCPQVILLDLNLPKINGLEVLGAIKADKRGPKIHIIVLTVSQDDEDIRKALRLGAEAYIVKPVGFDRFLEITPRLDFWLTLSHHPNAQLGEIAGASSG